MSFPSEQFYASRLLTGSKLQSSRSVLDIWPSSSDEPIAFIHIDSIEMQTPVETDGDNDERLTESSVTNVDQVLLVVSFSAHSFENREIQCKTINTQIGREHSTIA